MSDEVDRRRFLQATGILAGAAIASGGLPLAEVRAQNAAPAILHVVELSHSGVDLRVALNGVEILRSDVGDHATARSIVNGWMTAHGNDLTIYAGIPAHPDKAQGHPSLTCRVLKGPAGQASTEVTRFEAVGKTKFSRGARKILWRGKFPSAPFYGPWRWEKAEAIKRNVATTNDVLQLLSAVVAALNAHDAPTLLRLFHVEIDEISRALGAPAVKVEQRIRDWSDNWTPTPNHAVKAKELSFTLEAGNRLLRIERADGGPVFALAAAARDSAPERGPNRVYAAKLGGRWALVR